MSSLARSGLWMTAARSWFFNTGAVYTFSEEKEIQEGKTVMSENQAQEQKITLTLNPQEPAAPETAQEQPGENPENQEPKL